MFYAGDVAGVVIYYSYHMLCYLYRVKPSSAVNKLPIYSVWTLAKY